MHRYLLKVKERIIGRTVLIYILCLFKSIWIGSTVSFWTVNFKQCCTHFQATFNQYTLDFLWKIEGNFETIWANSLFKSLLETECCIKPQTMCKNCGCQIAYFSKLWVLDVAKVHPSYDLSCAIISSFNFKVTFNIASPDITESQLMLYWKWP